MSRTWRRRLVWAGLVLSLLGLPVGAGWFGDSLMELVKAITQWPADGAWYCLSAWFAWLGSAALWPLPHEAHVRAAGVIGGAATFGLALWFLHRHRNRLLSSDARILPPSTAATRTVLIMGLSPLTSAKLTGAVEAMYGLPLWELAADAPTFEAMQDEANKIVDGIRRSNLVAAGNSWQQNLRMIWAHVALPRREPLRAVLVLTSRNTQKDGSEGQVDAFIRLVEDRLAHAYREGRLPVPVPVVRNIRPGGIDFEDYTEVVDALTSAITMAESEYDATHNRICVDVTPGLKIYSIAAAMVTMNRRMIFGYTTQNGVCRFYDSRIAIGAALGDG